MKLIIEYIIDRKFGEYFFTDNLKLRAQFNFWDHPEYQFTARETDYYEF